MNNFSLRGGGFKGLYAGLYERWKLSGYSKEQREGKYDPLSPGRRVGGDYKIGS